MNTYEITVNDKRNGETRTQTVKAKTEKAAKGKVFTSTMVLIQSVKMV